MMTRRVPLARKNLFQDRRRALLAVGGVGAALVLVLVLAPTRASTPSRPLTPSIGRRSP
jgi:hypothetical protein